MIALAYSDETPRHVAIAMVMHGCAREPMMLPAFGRAKDAAAKLGGFDAKLVATGQVSAAVRLRDALDSKEALGGLSVSESRAREALDAWIEEFEDSAGECQ